MLLFTHAVSGMHSESSQNAEEVLAGAGGVTLGALDLGGL